MHGLSTAQQAIFQRISYGSVFTGIAKVINGRSATALRAAEPVRVTRQPSLPADQWKIEISSWFSTGLAMLQFVVQEYATPGKILPGTVVLQPETAADRAMCSSQKTLTLNGTTSFSVLGLAIILTVGILLILTSFVLETVIGWIGLKSRLNWVLDDKLQLQRMVFESRGVRWTNTDGPIPVTEAGDIFCAVGRSAESESLMAQDEKVAGINVTEVR